MSAETAIKYALLPEAGSDGTCVKCQFYPNEVQTMTTDEGERRVVVCTVCETVMRTHPNQQ